MVKESYLVEKYWHRVLVEKSFQDLRLGRAAKCFFIDQGDHIDIPERDMRVLLEEFSFLPAQAKPVQLAGLKGFVDNPSAKRELTNLILRKRFIAKVFRRSTDSISVILFNEKKEQINGAIIKQFEGYLFMANIQNLLGQPVLRTKWWSKPAKTTMKDMVHVKTKNYDGTIRVPLSDKRNLQRSGYSCIAQKGKKGKKVKKQSGFLTAIASYK